MTIFLKISPDVSSDLDENSLYNYYRTVTNNQNTVLNKCGKYSVFISYTGLVNNEFIDLLEIDKPNKKNKANEIKIETINEAIELLLFGLASRNESISHRILVIKLSLGNYRYSKLSIVDLAYQNNLKQTECVSTSIMALRNCFEALKEKRYTDIKIPYRESKLTWALKNFLCTESKIKIILCLNPASEELNHTCVSFRFHNFINTKTYFFKNVLKFANIKFDFESNFKLTINPKKTDQSSFFKNFVDYEKIDDELFDHEIYEKFKEEKTNDKIIVTIDDDKSEYFKRCKDITKLIKSLNEIHSKINQIKFTQSFDIKINDLNSEIEKYLNKSKSLLVKNSVTTFGNVTESFIKINTLKSDKFQSNQYDKKIDSKIEIPPKIKQLSTHLKSALKLSKNDSFELKNGVPVANRRGKKRSKSVEVWLNHKPQNMAKLDTLMQPLMSKKYSVKKIEFKDTKKSSKYVLTHQQQDENGEVVTNLIKGDIIKSPSGGSSVIFTDIERLHLKSTQLTKPKISKSSNTLEKNPFIIEDKVTFRIYIYI